MAPRTSRTPEKTRTPARRRNEWQPRFLESLRRTCNVSATCEAVGVGRQTAYDARERDADFADLWDAAVEEAVELLEGEARRRAYEGTTATKVFQALIENPETGEMEMRTVRQEAVREYSDTLLIFLLKAHKPKMYRDRVDVSLGGKDGLPIRMTLEIPKPNGQGEEGDGGE